MKKTPLHKIAGIVLGLLFLVSAFAKAWEADVFATMLLQYGPQWFGVWAPIIIFSYDMCSGIPGSMSFQSSLPA